MRLQADWDLHETMQRQARRALPALTAPPAAQLPVTWQGSKMLPRGEPMGMPVKLSDELVNVARKEAAAADRSITAQIEHWAKLGQSVEAALRHEDALAVKASEGKLAVAFPIPATRDAVYQLLRTVASA